MLIHFDKFHGAGNDFIMIDCREGDDSIYTKDIVNRLCDRHFGIGADGLILLTNAPDADFRMIYFNSDGREGSMCGNGGRCITAFAEKLGIAADKMIFKGIDGMHEACITGKGMYKIKMIDVAQIDFLTDGDMLNTGSPHFIKYVNNVSDIEVFSEGKKIRYEERFGKEGTNVNFVEETGPGEIRIRTYERGVENETLACGTGSVAAAISAFRRQKTDKTSYLVHAPGGDLTVSFDYTGENGFNNIWLEGPAEFVFSGSVEI